MRDNGVTIILTTHYIEEAEEMADRIGVINKGELVLVEDKATLMRKLGKKQLALELAEPLAAIPDGARRVSPRTWRRRQRARLHLRQAHGERTGITPADRRAAAGRHRASATSTTRESSLEDIFVSLVKDRA